MLNNNIQNILLPVTEDKYKIIILMSTLENLQIVFRKSDTTLNLWNIFIIEVSVTTLQVFL